MRASGTTILIAALLCGVLAAGTVGCGDDDGSAPTETEAVETQTPQPQGEDQPLSPIEERGRELFVSTCGSCHTFEAAGTQGTIGPSLDEVPLNKADVLKAIEIGGRGSGNMPPNLLTGEDAEAVATFVAENGPGA